MSGPSITDLIDQVEAIDAAYRAQRDEIMARNQVNLRPHHEAIDAIQAGYFAELRESHETYERRRWALTTKLDELTGVTV